MGLSSVVGSVIGGLFGSSSASSTNRANLRAVRETNATNREIAASANAHSAAQSELAFRRDRQQAVDARIWDRRQVLDARNFDRGQVVDERRYNLSVSNAADQRDRNRFVADREYSRNQAALAEARDRSNFLENRAFERANFLENRSSERSAFLENRSYAERQQLAAEGRQREYAAADLADARAYADPAAERSRLEAAGFNPLGRADGSTPMNNIGGSIASAPALLPAPSLQSPSGAQSPSALAISGMGTPDARVPAGGATAASQIARSQMAKFNIVDPVVPTMQAYIQPASNHLGEAISDAFASYEDSKMREQEFALRKTQLEIEQQRASELMQRATMRPIVGGVYSPDVGAAREAQVQSGGSSLVRAPRIATSGRVVDAPPSAAGLPPNVKAETYPMYVDVFDQKTGNWVQMPNPDVLEVGPGELVTGGAMIYGKQAVDKLSSVGNSDPYGGDLPRGTVRSILQSWQPKASAVRPMTKPDASGVQTKKPRVVDDKKKSPFDPYALGNPWLNY